MTEDTALTEIRRLELEMAQLLEAATSAAAVRIEQARREAYEQMAIAAADAQSRAIEIGNEGHTRADRLIAEATPRIGEAVEALVELVLPQPREPER